MLNIMKKTLAYLMPAIVILFFYINFSFGQNANKAHKENDSALIIKLENDWAKALVARDKIVFNKLLADDFFLYRK